MEEERTTDEAGTAAGKGEGSGRNRRWREENREALEAYARGVERDGSALARFRSF